VKREKNRTIGWLRFFIVSLLLFSWVPPVSAEGLQGKPLSYDVTDFLKLELPGYYRFRYTHLSTRALSQIPPSSPQRAGEQIRSPEIDYTEHRIRLEPKVILFDQFFFSSQVDILSGMLSGRTSGKEYMWFAQRGQRWNDIDGADTSHSGGMHVRRYYGSWESPVGLLRVGRQGSNWGLGILANDGNGFRNDFGDAYYGDNVDRVLFGTKPYSLFKYILTGEKPNQDKDPVTVAFAYDWHVARDNSVKNEEDKEDLRNASDRIDLSNESLRDDLVHQYVGAIRVETEPFEGGFYIVRRYQDHFDALVPANNRPSEEFLRVWVFDVYGKLKLKPSFLDGGEVFLEGELARIVGETNLTVSRILQQPGDPFPVSDISQLGWVVRGGVRHSWVEAKLETGYASGDSNPFDDQVKNFKFHPDYNVGMILFDDLLGHVSSASAFNATLVFDEGGPVRTLGADLLPSNGSVTNAVYINPTIKIQPTDCLETVVGVLWARTATDFVDPAIDFLFGGAWGQFNPLGGPSGNYELGWEIDLGVKYTWDRPYWDLVLGAQYAHFFPGDVFQDANGNRMDDIDKVQVRFTLVW